MPNERAKAEEIAGRAHFKQLSDSGCRIAYCEYSATGEGVTIMVAVGCSAIHAVHVFKRHADAYFHPGMVVDRLDSEDPKVMQMMRMVPVAAVERFGLEGYPQYYGEVHFNPF